MATTTEKTPAAPGVVATESNQAVPAISLEKVSKTYRSGQVTTTAVESIDLEIRPGEFFSLLGPSGCGKTTTMRMIAGFEEPTSGVVRLSGKDVTGVPPNRRDVNMVFQSYALYPHMTVAENVAFGLKRKKVPRPRSALGSLKCSNSSSWGTGPSTSPGSFLGASSSVSHWPAPSSTGRAHSCSTNLSVLLT